MLKESSDLQIFSSNPLTLRKLALFMVDAMRQTGKSSMPFVIASLNKQSETYLTIGIACKGKSKFANSFRKCADATRARIRQDRFEGSIVEIENHDISKFMENLQIFL